jgi:NAD(P)-dependent dehydrogenase (short-subunit alcohol dehydrogenase family)
MGSFEGRVVVVTGAGSGMGLASCQRFHAEGAAIVAVDVDQTTAAATAEATGGVAVAGDVSDPATWEAVLEAADGLGGLDVAHLNAGVYGYTGPIEELPIDLYQRTVEANIGGVVLGTRAVVPALRARGGGAIVVTASIAGIVAFPLNPLYTLTKSAVTGFVQAMAPNLMADGISIDAVCPGIVDTPMTLGALGGADPSTLGIDLIPPAQVIDAVVDLASSEGTGRSLAVLAGHSAIPWTFPGWGDVIAAAPTGG